MIVRTFDGMQHLVNGEQGKKIQAALLSDNPPQFIKIRDSVIRTSSISSVQPGGYTEADHAERELLNPGRSATRISDVRSAGDLLSGRPQLKGGSPP